MLYLENGTPIVQYGGLNTLKDVDFSGASSVKLPAGTTINGSSLTSLGSISSPSANAFSVGLNGTTNPALNVDSSAALQADGLDVVGGAAGSGVALAAISSGANAPLTIDALGSGQVKIGGNSTGLVVLGKGSAGVPITFSTTTDFDTQTATLTIVGLLGGVVTQNSKTGASTATTPTGAQMSTGIAGITAGYTFQCLFYNRGDQTSTITAGASGVTVYGTAAVPTHKTASLTFVCTGANTWACYVLLSA